MALAAGLLPVNLKTQLICLHSTYKKNFVGSKICQQPAASSQLQNLTHIHVSTTQQLPCRSGLFCVVHRKGRAGLAL